MKFFNLTIIFICAIFVFLLQITLFQFLKIKHTKLDLILIFIVYTGLKFGSIRGMAIGFILGLIEDIMSITLIGINTFSKTLLGFLSGKLNIFYKDNKFAQVLIVFVFTLLDSFIVFVLIYFFQKQLNLQGFVRNLLPVMIFLNSIFSPLIFILFTKIYGLLATAKKHI